MKAIFNYFPFLFPKLYGAVSTWSLSQGTFPQNGEDTAPPKQSVALLGAQQSDLVIEMSTDKEELTLGAADESKIIQCLREDVKLLHDANDALAEKIEGLKMEKKADELEIKHLKEELNCLHYEKDALMDQIGELQKHTEMCQLIFSFLPVKLK